MFDSVLKYFFLFLLTACFISACRDPFVPDLVEQDMGLLVVEGHIHTDGSESQLILSRSLPVWTVTDEDQGFLKETGATVILSSPTGSLWLFEEQGNGVYSISENLPENQSYFLSINLRNGSSYISDELIPVNSPPITSLGFERREGGVSVFVNTQGNDQAQFFLWQYEEDWTYRSPIPSSYIYNPETRDVEFRRPAEQNSLCWNQNRAPNIVLENAARFNNNTIEGRELLFIPEGSERMSQRYRIKVRQIALQDDAFRFWEIMRRNSEDIGGIFSPLPSILESNISSQDPGVAGNVVGWVTMGRITEDILYINARDVTPWRPIIEEYEFCRVSQDTIPPGDYETFFGRGDFVPVIQVLEQITILGYQGASVRCVDCTLRGGTATRPEFWED